MYLNTTEFKNFKTYHDNLDDNLFNFENCFIEKLNNDHILDLCQDIIEDNKLFLEFDSEEIMMYNNKPKILSNKLYKTPYLYFVLMYMNGVSHPFDLNCENGIFVMNPDNIPSLLASFEKYNNLS